MTMKIVIADLDGTLLHTWKDGDYTPRPKEHLRAWAILTNQGGIPLRWSGFPWAKKYPTLRQALMRVRVGMQVSGARRALMACYHPKQHRSLVGRMLALIGMVIPLFPILVPEGIVWISFSAKARKPSPWGLLWLARGLPLEKIVYVGDEESDRQLAQNAGVRFRLVRSERSGGTA